jgi:hypothetical protein
LHDCFSCNAQNAALSVHEIIKRDVNFFFYLKGKKSGGLTCLNRYFSLFSFFFFMTADGKKQNDKEKIVGC